MLPVQIFIGSSDRFRDVEPAIEKSIRQNSSVPVDIKFIRPENGIQPTGCTGFTNLRYCVPEFNGYSGFAIYLDVDMIVLGDIAELYEYREAGKWVIVEDGSDEVAIISCGTHRNMPKAFEIHNYHKSELQNRCNIKRGIPKAWNCEDKVLPDMKLLHLTDLKCQPWAENPEYPHPCPEAVEIYRQYV